MTESALIVGEDLSKVWARAFIRLFRIPGGELSPLIFTASSGVGLTVPVGDPILTLVDENLAALGLQSSDTVANTIFPKSLWDPNCPRTRLFERFEAIRLRVLDSSVKNRHGHYFARLVHYPVEEGQYLNQLDHIIDTWLAGNHRRSALMASIFNPTSDHSHSPRRGFPCLHQVCFANERRGHGLIVTGFYALQYIFERGLGNFLGLARLGEFMAYEMGLPLVRVTNVAGTCCRDRTKSELEPLYRELVSMFPEMET